MRTSRAHARRSADPAATARFRSVLRFGAGTTAAFVLSEVMGWYPTFLAPLFAAMLLANIPGALRVKTGIALFVVQLGAAYAATGLTVLMIETPSVVLGIIGIVLLTCLMFLARGGGMLPILLTMVAFASIPVVVMVTPQQAGALPWAFTRSMALAICIVWIAHAFWQGKKGSPAPSAAAPGDPVRKAITGTVIILPLMLYYLVFGITDAFPVLITTVVLVTTFDPRRGATQAVAMIVGNVIGGLAAACALSLLQVAPNPAMLSLCSLLIGCLFGSRVERGGPGGAVALLSYNQTMVILGLALMPGESDTGIWLTRVFQFTIAGLFAVGMMILLRPQASSS